MRAFALKLSLALSLSWAAAAEGEEAVPAEKAGPLPPGMTDAATFHRTLVAASGALRLAANDIGIPALGWPLQLSRLYRSDSEVDAGFGPGWAWTFGVRLDLGAVDREVRINEATGSAVTYLRTADGSYRSLIQRPDWIVRAGAGYERRRHDGRAEVFRADGRLAALRGAAGTGLTLGYEGERLARVATSDGRALTFERNTDGLISAATDPLGRRIAYAYASGSLTKVTDALGRVTTYRYNLEGRLVAAAFADQRALAAVYEPFGRVKLLLGPATLATRIDYDSGPGQYDREIVFTDAEGRVTKLSTSQVGDEFTLATTNGLGQRLAVARNGAAMRVSGPGGEATVQHDATGRPASLTDATGRSHDLKAASDFVERTRPKPAASEVDARGYPRSVVVDGERFTLTYDNAGRLTQSTAEGGRTTRYEFDAGDRMTATVDPGGRRVTYQYDRGDRLTSADEATRRINFVGYDAIGMPAQIFRYRHGSTRYERDRSGLLTAIVEPGNTTRIAYDAARQVTSVIRDGGPVLGLGYDAGGRPTSVEAAGRKVDLAYAPNGGLAKVEAAGRSVTVSRPSPGVVEFTRENGTVERTEMGPAGVEVRTLVGGREVARTMTGWNGEVHRAERKGRQTFVQKFDRNGRLIASGTEDRPVAIAYGPDGRLQSVSTPEDGAWTFAHDGSGRVTRAAAPTGEVYAYTYDAAGQLAASEVPGVGRTEYRYDPAGRTISASDARGETRFEYRTFGQQNPSVILRPDGSRTELEYDAAGRTVAETVTVGRMRLAWRYRHDAAGRLIEITNPDGTTDAMAYDARDRITELRIGTRVSRFAFDDADRLVEIESAGAKSRLGYDAEGRLVSRNGKPIAEYDDGAREPKALIDAAGGRWPTSYDLHGALVAVSDPLGGAHRFTFSRAGLRTGVETSDGRRIAVDYDQAGRIAGYAIGGQSGMRFEYGAGGALTTVLRPSGAAARFAYDAAGRLVASEFDQGERFRLAHDAGNRVAAAEGPAGRATYSYGPAGELLAATDVFGRTIRYEYDAIGRRTAMIGPGGERTAYRYGADGRLAAVTGIDGGETAIAYDPGGAPVRFDLPGRMRLDLGIEHQLGQSAMRLTAANGAPIVDRSYQRDAAGRLGTIRDGNRVSRYAYDAAHRLTGYTAPDGRSSAYAYDASGNLVRFGGAAIEVDAAFRIASFGGRPLRYDADGNIAEPGDGVRLRHDALGRVMGVTLAGGETISYRYDHLGRLIERRKGGEVVRYLYDQSALIGAYDEAGRRLEWFDRLPYAFAPVRAHRGSGQSLVAVDQLGTPVAAVSGAGAVEAAGYGPWGETAGGGRGMVSIGFTGAIEDREAGLVFLGARAYMPRLGRFTAPDPLGLEGGNNPYAYAANDPLSFADRRGTAMEIATWGPVGSGLRPYLAPIPPVGRPNPVQLMIYQALVEAGRHGDPAGQMVAQETMRLVQQGYAVINPVAAHSDPEATGFVDRSKPRIANVVIREDVDPKLTGRGLARAAVHEVTHTAQPERLPQALRELEAHLRGWMVDRRDAAGLARNLEEMITDILRHGDDWRGGTRILEEYGPDIVRNMAEKYKFAEPATIAEVWERAAAEAKDFKRIAAQFEQRPNPRTDFSRPLSESAGRQIGRATSVGDDLARALARGARIVGEVSPAGFMAWNAWRYLNHEIDTTEFVVNSAVDGAALAGFLPWPVGAAVGAHYMGSALGEMAAAYALPYVMDDSSIVGEIIRDALNLPKPPRTGHPCNAAVNCDCAGVGGGFLAIQWREDCKRCEAKLIDACKAAYDGGYAADSAARAGGFCNGECSVHGPAYSPRARQ